MRKFKLLGWALTCKYCGSTNLAIDVVGRVYCKDCLKK